MKKVFLKKLLAASLTVIMLTGSITGVFAATSTEITENTQWVVENASSEGGGFYYPTVTDEDMTATISDEEFQGYVDYFYEQGLFEKPESAGETTYSGIYSRDLIEPKTTEELEPIVEAVVNTLTFEEKVGMIIAPTGNGVSKVDRGQAMYNGGAPRLGVPVTRQHDASAGVTANYPTTLMPVEALGGSTFDTEAAAAYGEVIGTELVSIGSNYELGAQFDLARNIKWHRNDDTYGEDYYLTGEMAVAEVEAMQNNGAGAEGKHIGAYATSGDGQLWIFCDEQTLHTAYLYTFEQPMVRANMASVMTTYSRMNGYYTAANTYLLKTVLRDMWNWHGAATTDAKSTYEFTTVAGMDLEMGDDWNRMDFVLKYMYKGLFTEEQLDEAVRHNLYSLGYAGYLNMVEIDQNTGLAYEDPNRATKTNGEIIRHNNIYVYSGDDIYEGGTRTVIELEESWLEDYEAGLYEKNNELALKVAEEGIVLAKNDNDALPLTADDYTGDSRVIFVGERADDFVGPQGGEQSHGVVDYFTTPMDSATKAAMELTGLSEDEINMEAYDFSGRFGDTLTSEYVYTSADGDINGFAMDNTEVVDSINYLTTYELASNSIKNREDGRGFVRGESHTWTGYLEAPMDGEYDIMIQTLGGSANLTVSSLDGTIIGEKTTSTGGGGFPGGGFPGGPGGGGTTVTTPSDSISASASATSIPQTSNFTKDGLTSSTATVTLEAGKRYKVEVTTSATSSVYDQSVSLAWETPDITDESVKGEAYAAAAEPGTTVIYVFEMENGDYYVDDERLAEIKTLQAACDEAGNKFIAIAYNHSSFCFDGDWIDDTDAMLIAFYPGQAGGTALGNILTGVTNPSGSLDQSFAAEYKDTLLYWEDWDTNENGEYDEGENYDYYMAWRRDGSGSSVFYQGTRTEYYSEYNEGLNFGYRWYDSIDVDPQFWFGHGLSYTDFEYDDISIKANPDGCTVDVSVRVTNVGDVAGADCVQVYVGAIADENKPEYIQTSEKQLCQFSRTEVLEPGESEVLTMTIGKRMLSYWDSELDLIEREDGTSDKWVVAEGYRDIMISTSADDNDVIYKESVNIGDIEPEISAPESAVAGEKFQISAYLPSNITGVKLVNESGKAISLSNISVDYDEFAGTWNISTSVGTAGKDRTFTLLTKTYGSDFTDSGLTFKMNIDAATEANKAVRVTSASFKDTTAYKNQLTYITVNTTKSAGAVKIVNENGGSMGKTLISKNVSKTGITWNYSMKIGTSGERTFTVLAAGSNGVYNTESVRVVSISVK